MRARSLWVPYQPHIKKIVVKMYRAIRPRRLARMVGGRSQEVSKRWRVSRVGSAPKSEAQEMRRMVMKFLQRFEPVGLAVWR
jgi:hypothetical protein